MSTANQIAVSNLIASKTTQFFNNISKVFATANQDFLGDFKNKSYATGGNVTIKIPGSPVTQRGLSVTPTAIQDLTVNYNLTEDDIINVTRQVDLLVSEFDILGGDGALTTTSKAAIVDNYGYPAYLAMEKDIEKRLALLLKTNAYYSPIDRISKLGGINNFAAVQQVDTMMEDLQLTQMDRTMMFNTKDAANVSNSLQNSFNVGLNSRISPEGWIGGTKDKGRLAGLDCMRSNSFLKHTAGPLSGRTDITVVSVASDGLSIVLSVGGSSSGNLIKAGDRFAFTTIYWVQNPGLEVLPYNVTLAALEDSNGDGAGNVTLQLAYPLLASGEHINVNALPAPGAAVECFPSYNLNFAYTKAGVSAAPLSMGQIYGAANSEKRLNDTNMSVNVYMQGAVTEGSNIIRLATLVPMKVFTPYVIALPSAVA